MSSSSMGSGDDGYTGLLGGGRIPKHHLRPEAFGTVDEASAALGLARALTSTADVVRIVQIIQRDLHALMAELAAADQSTSSLDPFEASRVTWLEHQIELLQEKVEMPIEFVLGGDNPAGAAFDLARTIVRRAERLVAKLYHDKEIRNAELLRYLNRLSSLCFLLSLYEYKLAGIKRPSLASDPE